MDSMKRDILRSFSDTPAEERISPKDIELIRKEVVAGVQALLAPTLPQPVSSELYETHLFTQL